MQRHTKPAGISSIEEGAGEWREGSIEKGGGEDDYCMVILYPMRYTVVIGTIRPESPPHSAFFTHVSCTI